MKSMVSDRDVGSRKSGPGALGLNIYDLEWNVLREFNVFETQAFVQLISH